MNLKSISVGCECNDYSLLTAKTGIAALSVANPNLGGSGTLATVLTSSGTNGTIIKSIVIKATQATETGLVRLFIRNAAGTVTTLYKEVPIPTNPRLNSTPTPTPILQTIEVDLKEPLILENGGKLMASTQYAQTFNVIAEGLDWEYPAEVPSACCNFMQTKAAMGNGTVSTANTNLDGSGTITTVFTAPAAAAGSNGSIIKMITISALQNTHPGMVRLFLSPAGGPTWSLMTEVMIPETSQSGFQPSYKVIIKEDFHLEAEFKIGASTHLGESFAVTVEALSWDYPI
ncbi:MAG TPA: hypothetical protein VEB40_16055 [Flavipsychrobacter sp.]|nr:hypothetical protein [Flavipsychrobacter sp.]